MPHHAWICRLTPLLLVVPPALGAGMLPSSLTTETHAAKVIVVRTTADSFASTGACKPESLRCAINAANADGSGDTITFDIPSSKCPGDVCPMQLFAPLPALTATSTIIDGYSQPGAHQNTATSLAAGDNARVPVNINAPSQAGYVGDGLEILGSDDTVDGLSITNFKQNSDNTQGDGIYIAGATSSTAADRIWGNFLGVLPDGKTAGPNYTGIDVESGAFASLIGGPSPADANLISGNTLTGLQLKNSHTNVVENNLIGTSRTGKTAIPNQLGLVALGEGQANNSKWADSLGPGNVISGNTFYGIYLGPSGSGAVGGYDESIQDNLVGTNASGKGSLPNSVYGIVEEAAIGTKIGGVGTGNVISGNGGAGVILYGSQGDRLVGNDIGVDRSGNPIPNHGDGVFVIAGAHSVQIGRPGDATAANVIAHNTGYGVDLGGNSSDHVHASINRNTFFANTHGGIYLNGQAHLFCTYGSAYIPNTTPNDLTPCPLVLAATPVRVTGEACTGCTVEVYLAPNGSDAEGKTWLGTVKAGTCSSAPCTNFTVWTLPASDYSQPLTMGEHIVATATSPTTPIETSSFTRDVPVGERLTVTTTKDPSGCPSVPDSENPLSLRCAISQANNDGAGDEIDFDIPSSTDPGCAKETVVGSPIPVCTIRPSGLLPPVESSSTYLDGYSQPSASPDSKATFSADNAALTIRLDGAGLNTGNGLDLQQSYDSVEGFSVVKFPNDGIFIGHSQNIFDVVAGNFVGLDPDSNPAGNLTNGVTVNDGASFATIGGRAIVDPNLIDRSGGYGVKTSGGGGNTLRENIIGESPKLTVAEPNGFDGVLLYGTDLDVVGGFRNGEGNVIGNSFNDGIDGIDARQASINGNIVGSNGFAGIFLYLGNNNLVGGLISKYGPNIVASNGADGIDSLADSSDTIINNLVGSNLGDGIMVGNSTYVTEELRQHAKAALRDAGGNPASKSHPYAVVGGETPDYGTVGANFVNQNGSNGLLIGQSQDDADVHVWAPLNLLLNNVGGIDLYGSSNCAQAFVHGPNDNIECPFINPSTTSTIQGFACPGCTVEVFEATMDKSDAQYGEGSTYLGSTVALSNGSWSLNVPSQAGLVNGDYVTATSTQNVPGTAGTTSRYETSEFAYDVKLEPPTNSPPHARQGQPTKPVAASPDRLSVAQLLHVKYPSQRFSHAPDMHIRYRIR